MAEGTYIWLPATHAAYVFPVPVIAEDDPDL